MPVGAHGRRRQKQGEGREIGVSACLTGGGRRSKFSQVREFVLSRFDKLSFFNALESRKVKGLYVKTVKCFAAGESDEREAGGKFFLTNVDSCML